MNAAAALTLLLLAWPLAVRAEETSAPTAVELGEAPVFSAHAFEYRPGKGLRLGETGAVIGGFTNIKAENTQEVGREFTLDTFNVFLIYDHFSRFRAVAELQLKDIFVADKEHTGTQDFAFDVRRLFGDFTIADELRQRVGTFLTPIGYWNLILAPPLTWTTEVPLIVEEIFFQPTTTGTMLHGSTGLGSGQFGYSLFSQFLKPLENDPDLEPPDYTAGLRLNYAPEPSWSVGASYQSADTDGDWSHLGGLYLQWQHRRGEILSEIMYQDGSALPSSQWGNYLQGVLEIYHPFYVVGRYEHVDLPSPEPTLNVFVLGGVYKPFPFMAFKIEYRFVDHRPEEDDPEGFFSSFTTFF